MIFHNPKAENPLDKKLFEESNVIQIVPEGMGMMIKGGNTPIFSRINLPKFMINNMLINLIFRDFNE